MTVIDNRFVLPVGALLNQGNNGDERAVLVHTQDPRVNRQSSQTGINYIRWASRRVGKDLDLGYATVRDVAHAEPSGEPCSYGYGNRTIDGLADCLERNIEFVSESPEPEPSDTVVIMAPGHIDGEDAAYVLNKRDAGECKIITISREIRNGPKDYHVHSDHTRAPYLDELHAYGKLKDTGVFISTRSHPSIRCYDWRSIRWYTHVKDERISDKIPAHFACETVLGDALQVAINQLKADKVILLGAGGDVDHKNNMWFWGGVGIQAMCYWWSRAGLRIWNCSRPTTLLAGVMIGSVEDAFNPNLPPLATILTPSAAKSKGGNTNGEENQQIDGA